MEKLKGLYVEDATVGMETECQKSFTISADDAGSVSSTNPQDGTYDGAAEENEEVYCNNADQGSASRIEHSLLTLRETVMGIRSDQQVQMEKLTEAMLKQRGEILQMSRDYTDGVGRILSNDIKEVRGRFNNRLDVMGEKMMVLEDKLERFFRSTAFHVHPNGATGSGSGHRYRDMSTTAIGHNYPESSPGQNWKPKAKLRQNCKYCGKSYAASYVKRHEKKIHESRERRSQRGHADDCNPGSYSYSPII